MKNFRYFLLALALAVFCMQGIAQEEYQPCDKDVEMATINALFNNTTAEERTELRANHLDSWINNQLIYPSLDQMSVINYAKEINDEEFDEESTEAQDFLAGAETYFTDAERHYLFYDMSYWTPTSQQLQTELGALTSGSCNCSHSWCDYPRVSTCVVSNNYLCVQRSGCGLFGLWTCKGRCFTRVDL